MIKTLYLRVVLTFMGVVLVSIVLAFPSAMYVFKNGFITGIQANMLSIGQQIVRMSEKYQEKDIDSYLGDINRLDDNYALALINKDGVIKKFGLWESGDKDKGEIEIESSVVQLILSGHIYKSQDYSQDSYPGKVIVGIPLHVNGSTYALFIKPRYSEESRRQEGRMILCALLIVLVIGSLLILIASRYIVTPLKKLTLATQMLSRGNFNIKVKVKQRDELGILAESFNHMAGELKQLEQMRQDFISNVSHEIQSPLTSIRGFSKALRQSSMNEEDRVRYLEIIERESERLSRLTENLLKLASLESEHHPFHPETFDLDEQLRRVVVSFEPQWSEKHLDIELQLPKVKITGDEDQLKQVWINLMGNAIKFSGQNGKLSIRLEAHTDRVSVTIQDTGIGIHAQELERIFDRFYKADQARQREAGGSGLGLSIVRKIIELHRGGVEVWSEPGKGSKFVVTIPILIYSTK